MIWLSRRGRREETSAPQREFCKAWRWSRYLALYRVAAKSLASVHSTGLQPVTTCKASPHVIQRTNLATEISDKLNILAAQLKTRTRASLTDANHSLEHVMVRFFNALFGWNLINLNDEQPNFPAADLGDRSRKLAIQVTNQNSPAKISETAQKAATAALAIFEDIEDPNAPMIRAALARWQA